MYCELIVFLKEKDFEEVGVTKMLFEWGGKTYSRDPKRYTYSSVLFFHDYSYADYFKKYHANVLGKDFAIEEYISLCLLGNGMSELEGTINTDIPEWEEREEHIIIRFLRKVGRLDRYGVVLLRDEESIDARYRVEKEEELIDTVIHCLNRETPEGALITKQQIKETMP